MEKIRIIVRGGLVQAVGSTSKDIEVELIDWDNIKAGDEEPDENGIYPSEKKPDLPYWIF